MPNEKFRDFQVLVKKDDLWRDFIEEIQTQFEEDKVDYDTWPEELKTEVRRKAQQLVDAEIVYGPIETLSDCVRLIAHAKILGRV